MTHRRRNKQSKKYPSWWIYICLILVVVSLTYTNSRYASVANGEINIEIAKAIVEIVNLTAISPIEASNAQQEISFEIKNKNTENDVNDVTFLYKLQIQTDNIPITYTLYKVNGSVRTPVAVTSGISEEFLLQHTTEQTDSFVLVFNVPNKSYQDQTDNISISVTARQVID